MGRSKNQYSIEACERSLRQGLGLGVKEDYRPWVRIWSFGSEGVSSAVPGVIVKRTHELLSGIETRVFLLAEFSRGVVDIREQFPLLPLDHVVALAEAAGITYPHRAGAPYVLTTDLLVTKLIGGVPNYLAIAVKPAAKLLEKSILDKLEIERLWWNSIGVEWVLATEEDVSEAVGDNLMWISHYFREKDFNYAAIDTSALPELASILTPGIYLIGDLITQVSDYLNLSADQSKLLLCKAMWEHVLKIDLNISIQKDGVVKILNWDFSSACSNGGDLYENIA